MPTTFRGKTSMRCDIYQRVQQFFIAGLVFPHQPGGLGEYLN